MLHRGQPRIRNQHGATSRFEMWLLSAPLAPGVPTFGPGRPNLWCRASQPLVPNVPTFGAGCPTFGAGRPNLWCRASQPNHVSNPLMPGVPTKPRLESSRKKKPPFLSVRTGVIIIIIISVQNLKHSKSPCRNDLQCSLLEILQKQFACKRSHAPKKYTKYM